MLRNELEYRIRTLESGLDQFSGLEWIIELGEIAEIKSAVLNMTSETEILCSYSINKRKLDSLDLVIHSAIDQKTVNRRQAFQEACETLKIWLTPALPGKRRILAEPGSP